MKSYRYKLLWATVLVASIGILSRIVQIGYLLWDKYLGDVVYAAVFYLALSLIWENSSTLSKTLLTSGYVVAIEAFQLTLIPFHLSQSESPVIRTFAYIVLGSRFSWYDLLAYGIGIGGILLLDGRFLRTC